MGKPLRVAMLIQGYYPRVGGAEQQLRAVAPRLRQRGIDVHILTRRYPGLAPFETVEGIPVYRLPIPGPKAIASLIFTFTALHQLIRLRPHVIHAHELLSPATTAVMAKRLLGIPVIAKVLRGGVLGDLAKLKRKPFGRYRIATYRQFIDAFAIISQEIDTELAEIGALSECRQFIPNGVDTDRFKPIVPADKPALRTSLSIPEGPLAIFTGRLAAEKRVDQLISIWPAVRAAYPQASLIILGTGEGEATLKQAAGAGIVFVGRVDDVVPYLQAADVFVLPSATEGLSNALLEAMAVGLAVVATTVGGNADVITHGQNGWLIPPDTPAALQEAMLTLLDQADYRQDLGRLARERIVQDYALPVTVDRLCTLYHQLATAEPVH